jgi:methylenetetrahydrofolate dehydrogenase (NADP+)/methenyltetrahydrofolate cyclohydrolase
MGSEKTNLSSERLKVNDRGEHLISVKRSVWMTEQGELGELGEHTRCRLIDGSAIAAQVRAEVAKRTQALKVRGLTPRLDVVLVGEHGPSQLYVKFKARAAKEVGVEAHIHTFPEHISEEALRNAVRALNAQPETHGVLVQLPLPEHISQRAAWSIVEEVAPHKDVDGFHPLNQGRLGQERAQESESFVACTPLGCMRLIQEVLPSLKGVEAVVIGRSRIVGRPMAQLLTAAHATVTLCHSKTRDLVAHTSRADLVVAAAGVRGLIKAEHLKPGAVVIDVGIHKNPEGKTCGDVDFESASQVAGAITPVPGGVGPMTIAMLMHNVCLAAERSVAGAQDTENEVRL